MEKFIWKRHPEIRCMLCAGSVDDFCLTVVGKASRRRWSWQTRFDDCVWKGEARSLRDAASAAEAAAAILPTDYVEHRRYWRNMPAADLDAIGDGRALPLRQRVSRRAV